MLYRDYRRIEGYEDSYIISNYGEVFSLKRKWVTKTIQLKQTTLKIGYKAVALHAGGKQNTTYVHALVGNHFVGERTGNLSFDHIDRNRINNRADNIRLATPSEQILNQSIRKDNKLREKNITYNKYKTGQEYYILTITRNKKLLIFKQYNLKKYTLDYVIKVRDEFLNRLPQE